MHANGKWGVRQASRGAWIGFAVVCVAALAVTGAALSATGGGGAKAGVAGKTIGYLNGGPEFYYQCQSKGVKSEAKKYGLKVVELVSSQSPQKQVANGKDLIARGVDALLIESINVDTSKTVIGLAKKAGIPTILAGIDVPGATATGGVVLNFRVMGNEMGKYVKKNRPNAIVGIVGGLPGHGVTEPIEAGFKAGIKGSKVKIVVIQPADWNRQKARTVAQNIVQAHPEINLLYVENEDMAVGALTALQASGKKGVEMVSDNGSADGIKLIKQGKLLATVAQSPYFEGQRSVQLAAAVVSGKKITKENFPLVAVSKANIGFTEKRPFCG